MVAVAAVVVAVVAAVAAVTAAASPTHPPRRRLLHRRRRTPVFASTLVEVGKVGKLERSERFLISSGPLLRNPVRVLIKSDPVLKIRSSC